MRARIDGNMGITFRPGNGLTSQLFVPAGVVAWRVPVMGWLRLAVASLMVAGLFALLVAVARTPGVQSIVGEQYFRVSLVGHVAFSLNVWLLTFAAAMWAFLAARWGLPSSQKLGRSSLWLAAAGVVTMAATSLAGMGQPSLADYIPVLEHPAFAIGMGTFFLGIALAAANFLVATRHAPRPLSAEAQALRLAAVAYLMGIVTLLVALNVGWAGDWATLTWGPGHLLQVGNAAAMVAAWMLLLRNPMPQKSRALLQAVLPLFLLPVAVVPLLYLLPGPLPTALVGTLTWIGVAIPTTVCWLLLGSLAVLRRRSQAVPMTLKVSMLLFAVGVLAAVLGLQGDTRVTAHYHGTVGAVTVAFMGLAYRLLPHLGVPVRLPRLTRVQPLLYGCGLMLLVAGLFWASSFGGQRKVFEAFAQQSTIIGPMALFGIGALLAVVGGAAFVVAMGASLLAKTSKPSKAGEETGGASKLAHTHESRWSPSL